MQTRFDSEAFTQVKLIGDIDDINQAGTEAETEGQTSTIPSEITTKATNPRVQFLRLASAARTRRGPPGAVPPFQPSPPSLLRPVIEPDEELEISTSIREPSPLRNLALSNYSTSSHRGYESFTIVHQHFLTCIRKMPHAVNMPQSGFQALILCGPGIGLSTFTSIPSEFPKALVEIANRPMVWYVLDWCYRAGVTDITLVTPPTSKSTIAAALAQNPFLTSLPSPSPDLLAPADLEHTTPTAELLRLPEIQSVIKSDFLLLPCDLTCDVAGECLLESYLTSLAGLAGVSTRSESEYGSSKSHVRSYAAEHNGRKGGLSVWYNTANRDESVKKEECDFMCTTTLNSRNAKPLSKQKTMSGHMRNLVWTLPMSELNERCEEDKAWKVRQSLMRKHGSVKCMTQYRDAHIYFFPRWIKDFARLNEDFESVSEDLVGTWAKTDWRRPGYRARYRVQDIFSDPSQLYDQIAGQQPIEDEIDLLSLSSTQIPHKISMSSQPQSQTAKLASRVHADPSASILSDTSANSPTTSSTIPSVPPILAYVLPSNPTAALVRRVDTTPLLLSVSLLLAKVTSIDEVTASKSTTSPFAHAQKVSNTATIAPRVTISRSDTLIGANATIATQCVVKNSVIGANVELGQGCRVTGCVIMDGSSIGEKSVLTGTVVGKRCKIGKQAVLTGCEVQDANVLGEGTEGKGEKYLVGGLEDDNESIAEDGEEGEALD